MSGPIAAVNRATLAQAKEAIDRFEQAVEDFSNGSFGADRARYAEAKADLLWLIVEGPR